MKKFSKVFSILIMLVLIITQTSCKNDTPIATDTNYYLLDTICQIDIYSIDLLTAQKALDSKEDNEEKLADELIKKAFDKCAEYEKILSATKKESDIYKINHASGEPVKAQKATIDNLKAGKKYGDLSGGKFDITIGAVSSLWNFNDKENAKVPDDSAIKEAVKTVGYKQVNIQENKDGSGIVQLENPKAQIDLGGIAKGYICDKATELLEKCGVKSAVVNLGGNITTIGSKPSGDDFQIGIEKPGSERTAVIGSVPANSKTLVTSGIYERCFKKDGKTYHHILDPKTGYPANTDVELVTIVTDKGKSMDSDGLSTTCLTMGIDQGLKTIEKMNGVEAVFVDKNEKTTCTSGIELND